MVRTLCLVLLAAVIVVGCTKEPEPQPKPENLPPPEPTPQEIYSGKLKPAVEVFWRPMKGGATLSVAEKDQAIQQLTSLKSENAAKDNGRQALSMLQKDIEELLKTARTENRWIVVKACCQAYSILQPGSDRYAKLEQRADLMLKRPSVTVRGFFQVGSGSELYAFLDVTERDTGKVTNYKVREGEEFHGVLQLVRIIGDQQSVEILYIPVNDTWIVKGVGQD